MNRSLVLTLVTGIFVAGCIIGIDRTHKWELNNAREMIKASLPDKTPLPGNVFPAFCPDEPQEAMESIAKNAPIGKLTIQ